MKRISFRMDDVGASTKQFEVYSKIPIGNFLFLKYLPPFKAWGPYKELSEENFKSIFELLKKYNSKLTIALTACWVDEKGKLTPFPEKFPKQAQVIKKALKENLIEVANHGLTHCIEGSHLPRLFSSNRKFHREFWDFLPQDLHKEHLEKSQKILEDFFQTKVATFIPPGNVCTAFTWQYAKNLGLKYLSAKNDKNVFAFHDKDIVLNGVKWLEQKIKEFKHKGFEITRVKDLKDI